MGQQIYFEDVSEGMELPVEVREPTTRQLVQYAGASGDLYEIHYDKPYAESIGLPGIEQPLVFPEDEEPGTEPGDADTDLPDV